MDRIEEIDKMIAELKADLNNEIKYRVEEALSGYRSEDANVEEIVDKISKLSVERAYWTNEWDSLKKEKQ